jgi:hypothetical protein
MGKKANAADRPNRAIRRREELCRVSLAHRLSEFACKRKAELGALGDEAHNAFSLRDRLAVVRITQTHVSALFANERHGSLFDGFYRLASRLLVHGPRTSIPIKAAFHQLPHDANGNSIFPCGNARRLKRFPTGQRINRFAVP